MKTAILKFIATFIFLAMTPWHLFGLDVTGTITCNMKKEPISGVRGHCDPGHLNFRTDSEGRFTIEGLEAGTYHLELNKKGFSNAVITFTVTHSNENLEIVMQEGIREEMVVTATRTEKLLSEVPIRTEVVDREDIEMLAPRTLSDAVEFSTGVRVESNCQNCNFSQIRMLGLEGGYSQINMDGISNVSSLAMVYGVEQIPSRMIEKVEIVKGGGSAAYGSGSIAGVVNVITKEPFESGGSFESRLTSMDGESNYSLGASGEFVSPNNLYNFAIFGQSDKMNPIDLSGDGYTEVSERKLDSIGFKLNRYLLEGNGKVTFDISMFSESRRGGDQLDVEPHEANIAEAVDSERYSLSLKWQHTVNPSLNYTLNLSYVDMERDSYYGAGQDPNAYGYSDSPLLIFDGQFNHFIGNHLLSWGVQHRNEELEDIQPAYNRITDESYNNSAIFVQDDWDISPNTELIVGLRADKHSALDDAIVAPRGALKHTTAFGLTIRASVAAGFLAPQVFDEDLHITQAGGEGMVIRNDPNLKEESSLNYVLSTEWTPKVGRGYVQIETSMFFTAIDDQFVIEDTDDPETIGQFEFTRMNYGKSEVYGAEINLGYQVPNHFTIQLGVVNQKSLLEAPDPDFGIRDFFRTPNTYGNLTFLWNTTPSLDLFAGAKYTGTMQVPHYAGYIEEDRLETSPPFMEFDANATYRWEMGTRTLSISLGAKNLTDEYQDDIDQGKDRDAGYLYGPRFPRSLFASIKYNF